MLSAPGHCVKCLRLKSAVPISEKHRDRVRTPCHQVRITIVIDVRRSHELRCQSDWYSCGGIESAIRFAQQKHHSPASTEEGDAPAA
jgi:hypothetical protein